MRRRMLSARRVGRRASWSVVVGWAVVVMLSIGTQAQASTIEATEFFQDCPGTMTVEKSARVSGTASVDGDCTIEFVGGASLRLVDANVRIQGDLILEGDAKRVALRYSRIYAVGVIYVSTSGDVIVGNSRFDSAEVSFDAAEMVRVARSNFKQVDEPVTIMGGASCEVRENRPEEIGCTIDPTPECLCFDAAGMVAEVDAFLDTVPGATLSQCERPSIRLRGSQNEALVFGSVQLQDASNMCSVKSHHYALQVLQPSSEFDLTEEELGACQLAIERACTELLR